MNRIPQIAEGGLRDGYDVLVVGCGIFGLSVAINLLENNPRLKVAILERGLMPSGATTKNGGFGMALGYLDFLDEAKTHGWEKAVEISIWRKTGLELLFARLKNDPEIIEKVGCYDALVEDEIHFLEKLEAVNTALTPHFGPNCFQIQTDRIEALGFNPKLVKGLVYHDHKYSVHTGKAVAALIKIFGGLGGRIFWGFKAVDHQVGAGTHPVQLTTEVMDFRTKSVKQEKFQAKKVAYCINAFQRFHRKDSKISPGRGQVMVTKPIPEYTLKPSVLIHLSFYYLRAVDGRILFGGGRHLDFTGEATNDMVTTDFYRKHLVEKLRELFPSLKFEPDFFWAGIMGFEKDHKMFEVERVAPHVFMVFGCNGVGMAMGSFVGKVAAETILKDLQSLA